MEAVAPKQRLAGRYVLQESIASGGMASVWRAVDEVLARTVALKVLRHDLAEDPVFAERFQAEAVAAARLTHQNIISTFDAGQDDGVRYIVMEYFEGRTLRDVLDARGPLEPDDAIRLILPVLSALGFAHQNGFIHRDVKPANILVSADGRVKVADFGIAKAAFATHDLTVSGAVLGTVRYVSPEQVQSSEVDRRSDLYSTGVVLYELLTGRPPFVAETDIATAMMRLTTDPLPPRAIRPSIPRAMESTVLKAMARRPDDRFVSAESMGAALQRCLSSGAPTPATGIPPAVAPGRATRSRAAASTFRSWMLIPLIVVLLGVAVIAGGLALGRLQFGGPLGLKGKPGGRSSGGTAPLTIAEAKDYDPLGDGSEHPGSVALAHDGKPETAWTTDHYKSARFGGLKGGLGLWIGFGRTVTIDKVAIASPISGWTFELKPGAFDQPGDPLTATDGSATFTVGGGGTKTVQLPGVKTDGILIWITKLGSDGGRFAAAVGEVTVEGSPE
jgi:tRNA A-37 threonylcarbamoyl transferase component Bud32